MTDYEKETGEVLTFTPKRSRGRPKVDGGQKEWDIRLTPTDQVEVDFSKIDLSDFKVLLACKEGESNGTPRLHYHMYVVTVRSDSFIDTWLAKLGRATAETKGNAVFSKRRSHEGTLGYVVKNGNVVSRHGIDDRFLTETFKKSEDYRKEKETERKRASRGNENFLGNILKDPEVKRLSDPLQIVSVILQKYKEAEKRFPPRSAIESAVMYLIYDHDESSVKRFYSKSFLEY